MKRFIAIQVFIYTCMIVILMRLFFIQVIDNDKYLKNLEDISKIIVYGDTAPRGRIYDRNGTLLVDNKPVKVIYYKKEKGCNTQCEFEIADEISKMIEIDYSKVNESILKKYYIKLYPEKVEALITEDEKLKLKERKITIEEVSDLKLSRIDLEDLELLDKENAYIYHLMNVGYSFEEKIIKNKDVTNLEYATIAENMERLKGVGIRLDWERIYLYKDTLRNVLGRIGEIPSDNKSYYLSLGYSINDIVGLSYLEYQYDEYLKGVKNKYILHQNSNYELIEEGSKGSDLILSIDIELQKRVEDIIIKDLKDAKEEPNTEYLNKAFVIITDPRTGEVLAMAGKQLINKEVYDYSLGIINSSFAVGSVVKGASHIVGYNNGGLSIGEVRNDDCVKIRNTKEKCSIIYLGILNDITALKYSSNTYQFKTAIKVAGGVYSYDAPIYVSDDVFNIYRDTFKTFGLGILSEIDLPNERLGIIGKNSIAGQLLDLSIGQYDTYTPIQLSQYINTVANAGVRIKPYLLKEVVNKEDIIYKNSRDELGRVDTEEKYMKRVIEGFKEVFTYGGTAYYTIDPKYKPAGKTGTSQTFLDTTGDGKIDTATISTAIVAYAPYDSPRVTFTVMTPDVSHYSGRSNYQSYVMTRIVREVSEEYFTRYP